MIWLFSRWRLALRISTFVLTKSVLHFVISFNVFTRGFHFCVMKAFYFVLFTFLLPGERAFRSIAERGGNLIEFSENGKSNMRTLLQRDSEEASNNTSTDYPVCGNVYSHTRCYFDEVLTNVSTSETTSNAFGCCQLCQDTPACQAWTRDRDTGECILGFTYDNVARLEHEIEFDGGTIPSRIRALVMPATSEDQPIPSCPVTTGVRYPGGNRVGQGEVQHPENCCQICRGSNDCRSWYHSATRRRCILNGNVPPAVNASSNYSGGTI